MVSKVTVVVVIVLLASGGLLYAGSRFLPNENGHIPTTSTTSTSTNPTSGSHTTSSGSQSPLPNATLYKDIVRNIQDDSRIGGDKTVFTNLAVQLFTDLHYGTGQVKVLDPKTGNYVSEYLKEPTIQAMTNYSAAIQEGLPRHSNSNLFLLGNASQINPVIVDFSPISVKNTGGQTVLIGSQNLPRDYWITAEFLRNNPNITPLQYEWKHRMLEQLAFNFFDSGAKPGNFDNKIYTATSPEFWQITEQFSGYMDKVPLQLQHDGIGVIFPYDNATALHQYIADKTSRTIALLNLADIPTQFYDRSINKTVFGYNAMELYVSQLPTEYAAIVKEWKNPIMVNIGSDSPPVKETDLMVANWLNDRYTHGLPNTVNQFVGTLLSGATADQIKLINDKNGSGLIQTLNKIWDKGYFLQTIFGYERANAAEWGRETTMYRDGLPLAYTSVGMPILKTYTNPTISPYLAPWEPGLVAPDNIVSQLMHNQSLTGTIFPFNTVGLYSDKMGLGQDGATSTYTMISDTSVQE